MLPSTRNIGIYLLVSICALVVISRVVTIVLLLMYAPEDAEPYFYLKQILVSAICIGLVIWLWSKRVRQQA